MSRMILPSRPRRVLAGSVIAALFAGALSASIAPAAHADEGLAVGSLTTNGRVDPLGIPGADPVFGWKTSSDSRGVVQAGYEVEVGRSPGANDVWDTGRIDSSDQVDIAYGGPDLTAATQYFWRVQAWDAAGKTTGWSEPSTFETGLIAASDWDGADWIGKQAPDYSSWTDYTATLDFTLRSSAFGTYLRADGVDNAYMWQLNVSSGNPVLVPHVKVNGQWSVLANVDLRPFGFTAQGLSAGSHTISFALDGDSITTTLDDKVVDTRTATQRRSGQVGVRTYGSEAVEVSRISVVAKDGRVLAAPARLVPGTFSAGSIENDTAVFSGMSEALLNSAESAAPLLRTEFSTVEGKTVRNARAYAAARGVYELSLNGEKVGDQFLAPGYTEYDKRIQSQSYDVTSLVVPGANSWGAALGDGWWAGKVGLAGKYQYGQDLSLISKLRIEYTDGSVQWVDSGDDWKWAPGPFTATDNQLGETYDATQERAGWNRAGYDASEWKAVTVRPSATAKLSPQPDEPVRATQVLTAKTVTTPAAGASVYDVGQNMVGVARVTLTGRAGETVKIRHAEVLNPDGTLYTANLRGALATDYYTFASDGTFTYQPTFTQHGFRYIEISGIASAPLASQVKGVVLGSDVAPTGTLTTSDAMLNQLVSNVNWGARGNFLSIPTDTPARDERLGWTGDINIFAPTAAYMFDMRGFLGKWMTDVRDEQKASGSIPSVIPSTNGAFDETGVHWEDAIITVPHSLWNAYGDRAVLEQNWDAMAKFFAYARASAGSDNLEPGRATWFSGDWLHLDDPSDQGVLGTAAWAQDVRMMADMAEALGKNDLAGEYRSLYQDVRRAFTGAYVSADGSVRGNSQTGYALALGMDLISDADLKQRVGEKFVAKLALTDNHLRTGFVGTPWLLPALTAIGRQDLAYTMLQKKDYPSWGYEIEKGATTIWERWNSIQPDGSFGPVDMNSFNHYAYGAVADWMHQNIGGIRIGSAGYKTSVIAPKPGGGLTSGSGKIDTVYGELASEWALDADRFTLAVRVPVNTTSEIRIPSTNAWSVTEGGAPVRSVPGVTGVRYDAVTSETVVSVGSGSYAFTAVNDADWIAAVPAAAERYAADVRGLTGAPAALTAGADALVSDGSDALAHHLAGDDEGALEALERVSAGIEAARSAVASAALSDAEKATLRASLSRLESATNSAAARLRGVDASVEPIASLQPGQTASATIVVRNAGAVPLRQVSITASVTGLSDSPVTVSAADIAAGAEARIPVSIPVSSGAPAGSYDAVFEVRATAGDRSVSAVVDAPAWLVLARDVTLGSISVSDAGAPVTWLTVPVRNGGSSILTGALEVTPPAGWRASVPSAFQRIPAGETRDVRVAVFPPVTATGTSVATVRFVDRGRSLAQATASITAPALSAPPATPTRDNVDFGDSASETQHAVRGSATSGTSSEAGFTRRYSNNSTPGSWYSADVAVPASSPYLLRMRETWNSAGEKDYEILVDGVVAKKVHLVRTDGGQGTTVHQVLIDDPALLAADGTSTIQFRYPDTNGVRQYYDPSIADLWVLPRADATAPVVSAVPSDSAVQGDGGWYRSPVDVVLRAADDTDGAPAVSFDTGAGWSASAGTLRVTADGDTIVAYKAVDGAGNASAVERLVVRLDGTAPTITPAAGFTGDISDGKVPAEPACRATDAVSGVASCVVSGYGTEIGDHELMLTARDAAGNTSVQTQKYRVVEQVGPRVTLAASSRCIAGKVVLTSVLTNNDTVPISVTITTAYGTKTTASLAAGKNFSYAATTRLTTLPAGTVTAVATATIDGQQVSSTPRASYDARTC